MGKHFDFNSSYPYVMCSEKMPSGRWITCGLRDLPTDEQMDKYCYLMKIKFTKLKSRNFNTYIQYSKCETISVNNKLDNGRVIEADELTLQYITELDWMTIREWYTWEDIEILDMKYCTKDYLPKELILYILELYGNKTSLKNVEGKEEEYKLSKTYINALFGMAITALCQADVIYDPEDCSWEIGELTAQMVDEKLKKLRNWSKYEKRYFMNYSWGIWITSAARRNLCICMNALGDNGYDVLYNDTDSIFCLGNPDFTWYNELCDTKLKKMCDHYDIDFELTRPKTVKGVAKPLGYFDEEDDWEEFVTLGAKRYCLRNARTHELELTVSGVNKSAVRLLNNDIYNFKDQFDFDKDAEYTDDNGKTHRTVTKNLHTYVKNQPDIIWPDGYVSHNRHGINLRRTGYKLEINGTYKKLIGYAEMQLDITDDFIVNGVKKRWK